MADAVVSFALEQLSQVLLEQIFGQEKFKVAHVRDQVEEIRSELMMIKSFLKDADARQSKEEKVRHWVREIKDLAYRIEDVIETFVIRVESRNENSISESSMKRILKKIGLVDISSSDIRAVQLEIEDIKNKLTILRQYKETYGVTAEGSSSTAIDDYPRLRKTLPSNYPKGGELLIGMDGDVDLLIWSIYERIDHQVISICGMVGIGKTTLARHLCNHDKIRQHFEAVAWVDISQEVSTRIILQSICRQFFNDSEQRNAIRDMEEIELAEQLHAFLQQRRCLIVLDHISSRDDWERLRMAFPFGETRITILITTRSLEVAEIATAGKGLIHTMRCLTEEDAWKLFSQCITLRIGPGFNAVGAEMENIGRELVRRCKGLPLGIVALGEALATVYTLQFWRVAHEITKVSGGIEKVMQALTSLYTDLPYQLKSCLLYLAPFRKDTQIKAEKLYHLWMAEGLISLDNNQAETMMHMAEWYLNELRQRCIIYVQGEEVPTARKFKSCSLHDLINDFCLFMGRQEEFFVVMENEPQQVSDSSSWTGRIRRLVMYVGKHNNIKSLIRLTGNLRCLLVRNASKTQELETHEMLPDLIKCILQSRFLRILDFDRIDFGSRRLPKGIADLVHLRYLSFTGCLLNTLPASIGNLPYLQILDLRVSCKMEIPNVLQKMKRLRHLYLPLTFQASGGGRLRLNGLTQLETLENFNTEVCDVEDLFTLTKVWSLTINIEGSLENLKRLIDHMNRTSEHVLLSSLDVRNFDCYAEERHLVFRQLLACPALHVLHMEGHLGQIPPYRKISKNLTKMLLSGSQLQFDPMPTLEKLPDLRVLILHDDAFVGKEIVCTASNFPELRRLELSNLHDLESWRVEEGAMPKLSTLKIENCSQLEMLPNGLGFLTNLRELKILRMPETFKDRLREVDGERGADMDKVPRETSIIFDNDDNELSG